MPEVAGSWALHDEIAVWTGDWVDLVVAQVTTPSGQRFGHDVVRSRWDHAGCIVFNEAGEVMLVWRHRFITGRWGWELPSGGVRRDESAGATVARRIEADCGWTIHDQHLVWSLPQAPDITDRVGHLFWARAGEAIGPPNPDAVAQVGWFGRRELRRALEGSVHDLFTLAALVWVLARP